MENVLKDNGQLAVKIGDRDGHLIVVKQRDYEDNWASLSVTTPYVSVCVCVGGVNQHVS